MFFYSLPTTYYKLYIIMLNIKPEKTTKKFLSVLPDRSFDILTRRFGLGDTPNRTTLEAIGRDYGITRERVRQIENNAIKNIKKSETFEKESKVFVDLYNIIDSLFYSGCSNGFANSALS